MEDKEINKLFGFDPNTIGNRPRGYWIVEKIEEEEGWVGAVVGDLCIKTRDGGGNPIDGSACCAGNFIGTAEDGFDRTYRYYYYRKL